MNQVLVLVVPMNCVCTVSLFIRREKGVSRSKKAVCRIACFTGIVQVPKKNGIVYPKPDDARRHATECLPFAAPVVITYSLKRTKAMMLQRSILSSLGRSRQPFRSIISTNVAMIQNQPKSSSIPTHDSRQHDCNQRQYHPSSLCRSISSTTSPLQVPADTDFVVVQQNTGTKCK